MAQHPITASTEVRSSSSRHGSGKAPRSRSKRSRATPLDWLDKDASPDTWGQPVPRIDALGDAVSRYYPDYSLPMPTFYHRSGMTSYTFMGVDFTDPFDADSFPLPSTDHRLGCLRFYLSLIKNDALARGLTHVVALFHRVKKITRRVKKRRMQAFQAAKLDEENAKKTDRQIVDELNFHRLSTQTPTNSRGIVLFLYDAPLDTIGPLRCSDSETANLVASYGWSYDTVLLRAADAHRMRPFTREHVFDAEAWQAYAAVITSSLASSEGSSPEVELLPSFVGPQPLFSAPSPAQSPMHGVVGADEESDGTVAQSTGSRGRSYTRAHSDYRYDS
ncbi:hypothetical protein OC835_008068, partial [Tilletia horrida]